MTEGERGGGCGGSNVSIYTDIRKDGCKFVGIEFWFEFELCPISISDFIRDI